MTNFPRFLVAAAAIGGLAAPAAAQYQYPQPQYQQQYQYPQQYQQQYPGYPQQSYGYSQGYNQNPIGQIIDSLLGNRYSVTDRQAVSQCASAAVVQAQRQYRGYGQGYNGYNQGYGQNYNGYNQGYATAGMRVTAITDVQRRSNGLRVSGTMSSGYAGNNRYNQGYANRGYGAANLSFRCNVDYRGAVTNIRVRPTEYSQGY
jgi:hypothetical protein